MEKDVFRVIRAGVAVLSIQAISAIRQSAVRNSL